MCVFLSKIFVRLKNMSEPLYILLHRSAIVLLIVFYRRFRMLLLILTRQKAHKMLSSDSFEPLDINDRQPSLKVWRTILIYVSFSICRPTMFSRLFVSNLIFYTKLGHEAQICSVLRVYEVVLLLLVYLCFIVVY